jgi:hypothetical protein
LNATFTDVTQQVRQGIKNNKIKNMELWWRCNRGKRAKKIRQTITVSDNTAPPTFTRPANITIHTSNMRIWCKACNSHRRCKPTKQYGQTVQQGLRNIRIRKMLWRFMSGTNNNKNMEFG